MIVKKKQYDICKQLLNNIYLYIPQRVLGQKEDWKIKIHSLMGETGPSEMEERIQKEQKKLLKGYLVILFIGIGIFMLQFLCSDRGPIPESVSRPAYGEPSYSIPMEVKIQWNSVELKKRMLFHVAPEKLNTKEKEKLLLDFAKMLSELIRGGNRSLSQIDQPLVLPSVDPKTGISIRWFSEAPERIRETGEIDRIGLTAPYTVQLKAELSLGEVRRDVFFQVRLLPVGREDGCGPELERRAIHALKAAEERDQRDLTLPKQLTDGITLHYSKVQEGHGPALLLLGAAAAFVLFRQRYHRLEKESQSRRALMRREFPDMVNQLVLLLNAGLVVTAAFMEIADSVSHEERLRAEPLYYEMSRIGQRVRRSNASFTRELMDFAQASGLRELVRFASIVGDNVDKGNSLAEKLEREGELLREQQRRLSEERCRTAETKLTFPLMLLLLVLIMIAVAPVMLEM